MRRFLKYLLWFLGALVLVGVALAGYVVLHTGTYVRTADTAPHAQAVLLLGASVSSKGVLSPVLLERADAALSLYRAGRVDKILVTGDNGTLEYDEVNPLGKYLRSAGIPQKDIFLDYAGFDTYSSVYRARSVFGVQSMLVATQGFHLPRALYVARRLGIEAYGVDTAKAGDDYTLNALREGPAILKALFDLERARVPKYLGEVFPITGDGAPTWVSGVADLLYFKNE